MLLQKEKGDEKTTVASLKANRCRLHLPPLQAQGRLRTPPCAPRTTSGDEDRERADATSLEESPDVLTGGGDGGPEPAPPVPAITPGAVSTASFASAPQPTGTNYDAFRRSVRSSSATVRGAASASAAAIRRAASEHQLRDASSRSTATAAAGSPTHSDADVVRSPGWWDARRRFSFSGAPSA